MHVATKETDQNGVHILTSVIEGDGPVQLASEQAKLSASIISVSRTDSGGIKVQASVAVQEPEQSAPAVPLSDEQRALAYLSGKALSEGEARSALERFGASRILAEQAAEAAAQQQKLDEELKALVAKS